MLARRALIVAFAFTTVYFTGFFPPVNNPNELSRFQALVAFVDFGTFSIDRTLPLYGDHMDKSSWNGRFFSNKAPGLVFAAIPVYRALRVFFPRPRSGGEAVFVIVRLATVSLVSLFAVIRFSRRLERSLGNPRVAPLVAFAAVFGTPFLFYARSFFSHAWTASLLFLAWDLVRQAEEEKRAAFLCGAGLLAGWAAISEYPAAPVAAVLGLRAVAGFASEREKAFLSFTAGAAAPLLLLGVYDAVCFGSPFRLSSACEAFPEYAELARRPFFGIRLPLPTGIWGTLFSPTRGALLYSPFWLWAAAGWIRWRRAREDRRDCLFVLSATLLIWLPITGYPNWEGGWSLGMRYLLPPLFFAALAIPRALETASWRGWFVVAVVFAGALHTLASFSWPHFPQSIAWPVAGVSAWLVAHGDVAPNLGILLGAPARLSLVPPLLAVAAALALCLREFPRTRPARPIAAALGAAVFAASLALPPAPSSSDRAWRERLVDRAKPR